jgi:hypothetical protein
VNLKGGGWEKGIEKSECKIFWNVGGLGGKGVGNRE